MVLLQSLPLDNDAQIEIYPVSNNNSESEEDIPPQPIQRVPSQVHRPLQVIYPVEDIRTLNDSNVGKKRAKRQENRLNLLTMGSDEYPDIPEDLIQSRGSHFAHLMKNDSAMQVWSKFIDASEDIQDEILQDYEHRNSKPKKVVKGRPLSPDEAMKNLSLDMRKFFIKSNMCLGVMTNLENIIIDFFFKTTNKVFTVDKISSYERKILHGLALYYNLKSISHVCKITNRRLITLQNVNNQFCMPSVPLYKYLADKQKKKNQDFKIL